MGVGLVRSLQPPDILWIHWRVYNSIANTSKRVLFLPSSDVYVRSFLYLLYIFSSVQFSHSVVSDSLRPHESQPLYFNKTLLYKKLWAIKPHHWPQMEFFSSGGQESPRLWVIQQQPFTMLWFPYGIFLFDFQSSNHWKCFYLPYQLTLKTASIYFNRD